MNFEAFPIERKGARKRKSILFHCLRPETWNAQESMTVLNANNLATAWSNFQHISAQQSNKQNSMHRLLMQVDSKSAGFLSSS